MDSTSNINNELDQYGVWVKTPPHNAQEESPAAAQGKASPDDLFSDDIKLPPIPEEDENALADIEAQPADDTQTTDGEPSGGPETQLDTITKDVSEEDSEELNIDNFLDQTDSDDSGIPSVETQEIPQIMEAPISDLADGDISLDAFLSDAQDGEISVDDFFGDGESFSSSSDSNLMPDGDISLDEFLDSSDFGIGPEKQEKDAEAFEEPLDIDLTFEDTVVEEEADDDIDFDNLDEFFSDSGSSGSESIDLSAFTSDSGESVADDFDAMFDSIEDSAPQKESSTVNLDGASFGESESIDLSEFGLGDEDSGSINIDTDDTKSKEPVVQNFELNIEEDSIDSNDIGSEATEDNVTLDMDTSSVNTESLKQDDENPFSAPDSDFDVDSLLDSIVDETGSSPAVSTSTVSEGAIDTADSIQAQEKSIDLPVEDVAGDDKTEADLEATASADIENESFSNELADAGDEIPSDESEQDFLDSENEISTETSEQESIEDSGDLSSTVNAEEAFMDEPAVTDEDSLDEIEVSQNDSGIEDASEDVDMPVPSVDETETEEDFDSLNISGLDDTSPDLNISNENSEPIEENPEQEMQEPEIEAETTEDSMTDSETVSEENEFNKPVFTNLDEEVLAENSVESSESDSSENENSIDLDDFMGDEGFSDPSICEGNRSYSQEELEEQEKSRMMEENSSGSTENDSDATEEYSADEEFQAENQEETETVEKSDMKIDESYLVDASEGENSNGVIDDEDVIPSPFYSPLVENEGEASFNFTDSESGVLDSDEPESGAFDIVADSIVPADMSGLSYDENTGIGPAENSNETVAENENKGDNVSSIDDELSENTAPVETAVSDEDTAVETAMETVAENNDNIPDAGEEQMESAYTNDDFSETKSMISQIAQELSSLRQEINALKSEFAEIRNGKVPSEETKSDDTEKESGFFSDMDDDDTIALSGDELSNILSTAEFTPAEENHTEENLFGSVEGTAAVPEQEYENNLKVDFDDENLEEPNLDSVQLVENSISEVEEDDLPGEIEVPKVDDVLVESEYMSTENASDEFVIEPVQSEMERTVEEDVSEPSLDSDEEIPEQEESEVSEEIDEAPSLDIPEETDNFEEPSISDSLDDQVDNSISQDDYDYLSEDENKDEDEKLETGISEDPVNSVFNSWDAASPEEEAAPEDAEIEPPVEEDFQEPVEASVEEDSSEEDVAETPEVETSDDSDSIVEKSVEPVAGNVGSIPEDMKQEIKSVLAYMDQLLESLPEDKIAEFAQSEQFSTYKKLFTELGLS